ncbi:MAG: fluoride efflux transporter CrcB [Spirochaetae bacterium HGW-Spirochaetae-3]|jgi:CrcB protein|nr:MAG: fluoride efflux transporter CrcB [Spirochaetae bacterium HGW-Spirochaetae-3]
MNLVLIMVGGGLGALCRYAVSTLSLRWLGSGFSWGTAIANLVGCFLIGAAAGMMERSMLPRTLWLLLVTGFLGGFTTFSTFSLESVVMFREGEAVRAVLNVALNGAGGLLACVGGMALALRLLRAGA